MGATAGPHFPDVGRKERERDGKEAEMDVAVIEYSCFFIDCVFYDYPSGKCSESIVL